MYSSNDAASPRSVTPITVDTMLGNVSEIQSINYERDELRHVRGAFVTEGHAKERLWCI